MVWRTVAIGGPTISGQFCQVFSYCRGIRLHTLCLLLPGPHAVVLRVVLKLAEPESFHQRRHINSDPFSSSV